MPFVRRAAYDNPTTTMSGADDARKIDDALLRAFCAVQALCARTQIPINVYSTKNTSRLLVGCHTQASGYFWGGNSTDLSFGGPPLSIGPKLP